MPSDRRQVVVVDLETTGLGPDAVILEVAAFNMETCEEFYFVPHVTHEQLGAADPDALGINRYYERGVYKNRLDEEATRGRYEYLRGMLTGNTFAGSNPTFDTRLLAAAKWHRTADYVAFGMDRSVRAFGEPWHHRLLDLSAYAAGVLALPLEELPGLHKVCELLSITNQEEHSAMGDVRATAKCFEKLRWWG